VNESPARPEGGLIRSFIAVPLPPGVKDRLRAAQDRLRPTAANVKWVAPESLHITLEFLGGVKQEELERTWRMVSAGLRGRPGFLFRLVGIGTFPSRTRPRVIWAGVRDGKDELAALAQRTEQVCAECGFEPDSRGFQAHVTLGRVREPEPNPRLAAAVEELAEEEFGEAPVDRVLLMKSDLTPKGAIYTVLGEQPLG
jgi:2'-5' RNA ligase